MHDLVKAALAAVCRFFRAAAVRFLCMPVRLFSALTLTLSLVLVSCGGVGTGGTGTFAIGPITGLGSIFVSGVRFDDSAAEVRNDDGVSLTPSALQIGMTVAVEAGATSAAAGDTVAQATRVTLNSEIMGPASAIDSASGTLTVLGQRVRVTSGTVFDPSMLAGLSSLVSGQVLQIYGFYDGFAGSYTATRIESAQGASLWRLRGALSEVDAVATTLRVGQATLGYGSAANVPADLATAVAERRTVRLRLAPEMRAPGRFEILSFAASPDALGDVDDFRVSGTVTALASSTRFSIAGVPVDAAAAVVQGATRLKIGALAQARGPSRGGVVQAVTVLLPEENSFLNGFAFQGAIERLDMTAQTLVIKGTTIWWGRPQPQELAVLPAGSKLSELAVGRQIRVRAVNANSRLEATLINLQ